MTSHAHYAHPEILVDTDWVAENGSGKGVRLIEVDYNPEKAYYLGHVPGATLIRWGDVVTTRWVPAKPAEHSSTPKPDSYGSSLVHDVLGKEEFGKLASRHGIEADTKVVLYGDSHNLFAAYALWLFKMYGHENVCLMNGGRKKWKLEGRKYVRGETQVQPTNYRVTATRGSFRTYLSELYDAVLDKKVQLVDVRSSAEYFGETAISPDIEMDEMERKGHIPGAVNVPWIRTFSKKDDTFKSYDELLDLYKSRGIVPDADVVTYCRWGDRASLTWMVLKYLLGYSNVANYDASWSEWGATVGAPIVK